MLDTYAPELGVDAFAALLLITIVPANDDHICPESDDLDVIFVPFAPVKVS
jgi:hypothetical protein